MQWDNSITKECLNSNTSNTIYLHRNIEQRKEKVLTGQVYVNHARFLDVTYMTGAWPIWLGETWCMWQREHNLPEGEEGHLGLQEASYQEFCFAGMKVCLARMTLNSIHTCLWMVPATPYDTITYIHQP